MIRRIAVTAGLGELPAVETPGRERPMRVPT